MKGKRENGLGISINSTARIALDSGARILNFHFLTMFQIIFTPASAGELARMPKELQLQILGEFRGLPQKALGTELDAFGKLEMDGQTLHRFRVGDYRVYFERHELGVLVHRILSRHTLKDFLFRSGLKTGEDEALQKNPKFWELIESAKGR